MNLETRDGNILCQITHSSHIQMMGYVIKTEDDKIIVVDGGTIYDDEYLFSCIQKLSGKERPYVDAWFLTHPHSDHIEAFLKLLPMESQMWDLGKVYYHFPSVQFIEKYEFHESETIRRFYERLPLFADKAVVISQGDRYTVGQASFDILYTANPIFCQNAVNNSSAVIRMELAGQSVLFLGDLGEEAGNDLMQRLKDELKSDFCQMAHHGQSGVSEAFYRYVKPSACLWCAPKWLYENDAGQGYNTHNWQTVIVRGWMEKLGVKHHFVEKDGDIFLKLPFAF